MHPPPLEAIVSNEITKRLPINKRYNNIFSTQTITSDSVMASLTGKVAVITGASKGIGKAAAQRLAADGASIVINYNSDSKSADELVAAIGADRALAVQADVSKVAEAQKLVDAAVHKFGKIDIIMPNAGLMHIKPLDQLTETDFDDHFNLNVKGALFLVQKAVPHIPEGGRVIFVSTGVTSWTTITPG